MLFPTDPEKARELWDLQKKLDLVARLGRTAMTLRSEALSIRVAIEEMGKLEAPEGYHFIVTDDEAPLLFAVKDPGNKMSRFETVGIFSPEYESVYEELTVELPGGRRGFVGSMMQMELSDDMIWVYSDDGSSRVAYGNPSTRILLNANQEIEAQLV